MIKYLAADRVWNRCVTGIWVSRLGAEPDPQKRVFLGNCYVCNVWPFPFGTVVFLHGGKGQEWLFLNFKLGRVFLLRGCIKQSVFTQKQIFWESNQVLTRNFTYDWILTLSSIKPVFIFCLLGLVQCSYVNVRQKCADHWPCVGLCSKTRVFVYVQDADLICKWFWGAGKVCLRYLRKHRRGLVWQRSALSRSLIVPWNTRGGGGEKRKAVIWL